MQNQREDDRRRPNEVLLRREKRIFRKKEEGLPELTKKKRIQANNVNFYNHYKLVMSGKGENLRIFKQHGSGERP